METVSVFLEEGVYEEEEEEEECNGLQWPVPREEEKDFILFNVIFFFFYV